MWVMTIDQRASRRAGDRVDDLLAHLATRPATGVVLAPERTVGDEVQLVLDDPDAVVDLALDVLRRTGWSVGVGAGEVHLPLPASPRAGSGPAFVHARVAVEAAKTRGRPVPLGVRGDEPVAAADAEAVLLVVAAVAARRSGAAWQAIDAVRAGGTQQEVAARLGVSQQAVSARLRTALWTEEEAARGAAARLLRSAAAPGRMAS